MIRAYDDQEGEGEEEPRIPINPAIERRFELKIDSSVSSKRPRQAKDDFESKTKRIRRCNENRRHRKTCSRD
jgi:hypothetical protein